MKAQLTIRDLFWLVLVVGLAVGWWVDRQSLAKKYTDNLIELVTQLLRDSRESKEERQGALKGQVRLEDEIQRLKNPLANAGHSEN